MRIRYVARTTLWLDGRQLVQESLRYFTQEVHRFALADIQAIQFRRTPRGLIYNVILACLLFALALITIFADDPLRLRLTMCGIFAVPPAALLIVNLARGATCRTTLTTALGPQLLPSLSRVGPTRRALGLIAADISTVQGNIRPDEAALAVDRARTPPTPAPAQAQLATTYQNYNY